MKLFIASKNNHKLKEIKEILKNTSLEPELFPNLPEIEETGTTFEDNASLKAVFLSKLVDGYVIADDSGISVDVLDGAPGVFSARYAGIHGDDEANNKKLLKDMENISERTCRFVCVIALAKGGKLVKTFRGEAEGTLAYAPKGAGGFGYDPLFIINDGRSMAELSPDEKNRISHRSKGLHLLGEYFAQVEK